MEKEKYKQYIPIQIKKAKALKIPFKTIIISPRKNNKYRIELEDGAKIDYGRVGFADYLEHNDKKRRELFFNRWENHKNANDIHSPVYYILRLSW